MTDTLDLTSHSLLAISHESLAALRASLARDLGGNAATYLHEAGYGGAGAIYEAFTKWLSGRGGPAPSGAAGGRAPSPRPRGGGGGFFPPPGGGGYEGILGRRRWRRQDRIDELG